MEATTTADRAMNYLCEYSDFTGRRLMELGEIIRGMSSDEEIQKYVREMLGFEFFTA